MIFCMDEFGPLNLLPRPGKQWAPAATKATKGKSTRPRRRRRRATYNRNDGVRHLLAAYDLGKDRIYGHIKTTKNRTKFLEFCRYLRSPCPPEVRIDRWMVLSSTPPTPPPGSRMHRIRERTVCRAGR